MLYFTQNKKNTSDVARNVMSRDFTRSHVIEDIVLQLCVKLGQKSRLCTPE